MTEERVENRGYTVCTTPGKLWIMLNRKLTKLREQQENVQSETLQQTKHMIDKKHRYGGHD